jgi:hypothetical protein
LRVRRGLTRGLLLAIGFALGCRDQVFEPVQNGLVTTVTLSGDVHVITKADILFVIDASVSMVSKEPKIAAGLPSLIARLEALYPPVDYRLAVMTSSVEERFGPCDTADPNAPGECSAEFGLTGFQCLQNACVREFPQLAGHLVAAPGNPVVLDRAALSPAQIEAAFAQNVMVGVGGARQEQAFRALNIGFGSTSLDSFWRPDARLVVFVATDRDDCSDTAENMLADELVNGKIVDNCALQSENNGTLLDSVAAWVAHYRALPVPGGVRDVAIGAAVGLSAGTMTPGTCVDPACATDCSGPMQQATCSQQCQGALQPTLCQSECTQQCVQFCGSQAPGIRIQQAVNTMQGSLASICDSDYGPDLARLSRVIGIPDAVTLPALPLDPRAFFFQVTRGAHVINCNEGPDYSLAVSAVPYEMDIAQAGACRLLPNDHWSVQYLTK